MNSNVRTIKLRMVDKQFKLRQLSAKKRKSHRQSSKKFNGLKIVPQQQKKAA